MCSKQIFSWKSIISSIVFLVMVSVSQAQTPVAVHGQLSINGNRIHDKNGNNYQLRGMSMYWSNWEGKFWNYETLKWLRDDWHCNVIRAAMGVSPDDNSGYLGHPDIELHKMETVIEAAIDLGIYVVVDWHSHHAENELTQSKAFFALIAQKYGSYPNILYETYNEPMITDWGTIKAYHQAVVSEIRNYDSKNIIVLGTPFYSQNIDVATNSPLSGANLAYSLHYYAASHTFWNLIGSTCNKGYYPFVTEFGTCDASGAGSVDYNNSNTWWSVLDQFGSSWCNWAVSDEKEAASIVNPGSSTSGGWATSDLTSSGSFVRDKLRSYGQDPIPNNIAPYITSSPKTQSVPFQSTATFSVEVAGQGPFTYQWFFNGNAISNSNASSYSIASVTPQDTGTYYCTIANAFGTTTSKTVRLDVRYRSPYYSSSQMIPGVIQCEDYDKGGQNIGYYDDSYGNSGGGYRNDDVDIEAIPNTTNQYSIGFIDQGEWLSYSVNVGWDGQYTADVYYASLLGGGAYTMELDGKEIVPQTTLASTGDWYTFNKNTATIQLTKGEHIITFKVAVDGFNLDYVEFKSTTPPNIAPIISLQPKNASARVGHSASMVISAIGASPLTYQWYRNDTALIGATASVYQITAAVASDSGSYYCVVTNSLGTATSNVDTFTVIKTAAYLGIPAVIPGRVFCKNFDEGGAGFGYSDDTPGNLGVTNGGQANYYRDGDVDTEANTDGGSGFSIGYIDAGEWLEYSVTVSYTGNYMLGFRVASASTAGTAALGITVDGMTLINTLLVPNTGGWAAWTTLNQPVQLTAGSHVLRFKANQGGFNINYLDFTLISVTANVTITKGWNLFALPVVPSDSSITTLFAGMSSLEIKTQDQFYRSDMPSFYNSLTKLSTGVGYLIYNGAADTTITLTGQPVTKSLNIDLLKNGWNLVGISSVGVKANTTGSTVQIIKDFDGFYIPSNTKSSITTMQAGKAYFIKITK
jgi:endoglucanase